jgi:hypothetical protein
MDALDAQVSLYPFPESLVIKANYQQFDIATQYLNKE